MRACIVGGGLAGSLLAWRMAMATTGWQIDLVLGDRCRGDATAMSGGAVRAYEPEPEQRRLATDSMVELLASRTLREWSGFRQARFVTLRRTTDGLDAAVADIELMLPGWVEVVPATELERQGWAGLRADLDWGGWDGTAVQEPRAGYTSPARLRDSVLTDGAVRRRVGVHQTELTTIEPRGNGAIGCVVAGRQCEYDVLVVAAGAWTAALLRASGLPACGYRTKSIQYTLYPAGDWRPPQFVDGLTGLYGRPAGDGGLLLGLPSDEWDVDPDCPPTTPGLHAEAARLATARFPKLRIGEPIRTVGSSDCYADQPVLALRSVVDTHRLFTFSGGAGGSVKTALAASHRAAIQLVESGQPKLTSVGSRKGQP